MTTITAKEVNELRKATGAGMMDCKEALKESGGDYEGALTVLRKKGQKVAAKRADREANEGVVVTLTDPSGKRGFLMALACETDFVAKNEDFVALAKKLAQLGLEKQPASTDSFLALPFENGTVAEKLIERTGTIGEKIEIADFQTVQGDNIASYVHSGSKIGVILAYEAGGKQGAAEFFRTIAMHIAAMNPSIMSPNEFDPGFVAKEAEVIQAQIKAQNELNAQENLGKQLKAVPEYVSKLQLTPAVLANVENRIKDELRAEGKPEKIWNKILPGKMDRWIADNTLLDQERCLLSQFYALDTTKTVETAIKEFSPDARVTEFKRLAVG